MNVKAPERSGPPLAKLLARRLFVIAGAVFVLNSVAVGLYYGSDRRALEAEVVAGQVQNLQDDLDGAHLPKDAPARALRQKPTGLRIRTGRPGRRCA